MTTRRLNAASLLALAMLFACSSDPAIISALPDIDRDPEPGPDADTDGGAGGSEDAGGCVEAQGTEKLDAAPSCPDPDGG